MKAKFPEHSVVKIVRDITDCGRNPIKKDQIGTIVHIYENGLAYAVEFDGGIVETVFGSEMEKAE